MPVQYRAFPCQCFGTVLCNTKLSMTLHKQRIYFSGRKTTIKTNLIEMVRINHDTKVGGIKWADRSKLEKSSFLVAEDASF